MNERNHWDRISMSIKRRPIHISYVIFLPIGLLIMNESMWIHTSTHTTLEMQAGKLHSNFESITIYMHYYSLGVVSGVQMFPNPCWDYLQADMHLKMAFCWYNEHCSVATLHTFLQYRGVVDMLKIWTVHAFTTLLLVESSRICLQIFSILLTVAIWKFVWQFSEKCFMPMHMNLGQKMCDKFPKIWMDSSLGEGI